MQRTPIKAAVFLGNPGNQYKLTRHNLAWLTLESFSLYSSISWNRKFRGLFAEASISGKKLYMLQPLTYVNKSGESIGAMLRFYKIPPEECLVVHDDLELSFGKVVLKSGGGLGGHNGLKSIAVSIGTRDFFRLRLGISRPAHENISAYVLGRFSKEEEAGLPDLCSAAEAAILKWCASL
jgi:peptidyl-tRNA hydrolase, PTH1 family